MRAVLESVRVNHIIVVTPHFDVRVAVHLPDVVQDGDGAPMNNILFNFTDEGLIMDVIDDNGQVVGTKAQEYVDLIYDTPETQVMEVDNE